MWAWSPQATATSRSGLALVVELARRIEAELGGSRLMWCDHGGFGPTAGLFLGSPASHTSTQDDVTANQVSVLAVWMSSLVVPPRLTSSQVASPTAAPQTDQ